MGMVEKTAAFRQRRAADTARWRERLHRGVAVYHDASDQIPWAFGIFGPRYFWHTYTKSH
jgi:hypothetical protein